MYVWGANSYGQLGTGNNLDAIIPEPVSLPVIPSKVTGGGGHSILLSDGGVYTCGNNDNGQTGLLSGGTSFTLLNKEFPNSLKTVVAGWDCSFIVDSTGSVFAWGSNKYGQLGLNIRQTSEPTRIDLPSIINLSCGLRHTVALSSEGEVFTWGSNRRSQLGLLQGDHEHNRVLPCRLSSITSSVCTQEKIVGCAAGAYHSVVWTEFGRLGIWGDLKYLANSVEQSSRSTGHQYWFSCADFGGARVIKAACGWSHIIVLTDQGTVFSWGRSTLGALGRVAECCQSNGSDPSNCLNFDSKPNLVKFYDDVENPTANAKVIDVVSGSEHCLALDDQGQIWVWGWNEHGMCGIPSTPKNSSVEGKCIWYPQRLPLTKSCSSLKGKRLRAVIISAGYGHSIAVTLPLFDTH